jgi:hypothetical protein
MKTVTRAIRLLAILPALAYVQSTAAGPVGWNRTVVDAQQGAWGKDLADVDGDGKLDIVAGGGWILGDRINWYSNGSTTRHAACDAPPSHDEDMDTVAAGDINGDGAPDIVGSKGIFWCENPRGSGGSPADPWEAHQLDEDYGSHDLRIADIDRNGLDDILARSDHADQVGLGAIIYFQMTPDVWNRVVMANVPLGQGVDLTDINGDGRLDVVAGNAWYAQPVNPYLSVWTQTIYAPTREPSGAVASGDFNRDGRVDLVLIDNWPWLNGLTWYEQPADPVTGTWTPHQIGTIEYPHSMRVEDIDRNGWWDVITAEQQQSVDHRVMVYYNYGTPVWSAQVADPNGGHNLVTGDMDGDGDVDMMSANWHPGLTDGGDVVVWYNQLGPDLDGDGIVAGDNCSILYNPTQRNTDGDAFGSRCDPDLNNDGIVNYDDRNIMMNSYLQRGANLNADLDGNNWVNYFDLFLIKIFMGKAPGPAAAP